MEIKAKCNYDFEAIRALTHLGNYKRANPKKRLITWMVLLSVLMLAIVLEMRFFPTASLRTAFWVSGIAALLELYLYFLLPKIRYNAMAKSKDIQNSYIFTDDSLKAATKSDTYNGEAEISYSMLFKVYETSRYFFIFQTKNQAFIVDKHTLEGGTATQLREKLTAFVKDKFIICRY